MELFQRKKKIIASIAILKIAAVSWLLVTVKMGGGVLAVSCLIGASTGCNEVRTTDSGQIGSCEIVESEAAVFIECAKETLTQFGKNSQPKPAK